MQEEAYKKMEEVFNVQMSGKCKGLFTLQAEPSWTKQKQIHIENKHTQSPCRLHTKCQTEVSKARLN